MRRWAFAFSILGIFILFLILIFSKGKEIKSVDELSEMIANSKVIVSGLVESERAFGKNYLLILDNEIELICDCRGYSGKSISVLGRVNEFNGKKRVEVLRVI